MSRTLMSFIEVLCLSSVIGAFLSTTAVGQQTSSTIVFEDRFDRKHDVGNDWKLNTKEDHQFVIEDGELHVTRNTDAKHYANLLHKAAFRNGALSLRFKLVNNDDSFRVQVRDSAFTRVKQGMLFNIRMGDGMLELQDAIVAYDIKQDMKSRKAANPSPQQQIELDKVTKTAPVDISVGTWHDFKIDVDGDDLTVMIDGKEIASLSSKGISHPTKDNFRIEVGRSLVIDDVKVAAGS
tara:strand:+ start:343997 stop:344707 length:711 start_codon:yes stop_codon:yes gene_type:complete